MGTIKDLTDLVAQLIDKANDRKSAAELREVQRMIGSLQSDQATLHERNITLMDENAALKQKLAMHEQRIAQTSVEDILRSSELDEMAEKILLFLANTTEDVTRDGLIHHLNLSQGRGDYLFDQLLKRNLIRTTHARIGVGAFYGATPEGREYLVRRGLI